MAHHLPITFDMRPLLEACIFGKSDGHYVFTLPSGAPVREDNFRTAWSKLTEAHNVGSFVELKVGKRTVTKWKPSLLVHDFRRSAVRNFIQSGVSQAVAMTISGHATDSVFRRYQIVSEADIIAAGKKISLPKKPIATGEVRLAVLKDRAQA
jgi:hypothetical protein